MIEPNKRFFENSEAINDQGAIASSATDGSWLKLEHIQRDRAVLIARGLTERLEMEKRAEYSGGRFNFMLSHDLGDVIERTTKNRSPLLEVYPANRKFGVRLEKGINGRINLLANIKIEDEDNTSYGNRAVLQTGYIAVMNELMLVEPSRDELEESVENVLEELQVEVKGSSRTADEVKTHREHDIQAAPETFRLLNVKEADDITLLQELWADRSLDKVAIVDLFLHLVNEKQSLIGNDFPEITLKDLVETGQHLPAADLRGDQQLKSAKFLTNLGYDSKEIERRFLNADKNRALGFRYATWLIELPFMADFKDQVKKELANGVNIPSIRLFTSATSELMNVYKTHKDNADSKYNLTVGWQSEEYERKLNFLRSCVLLCMDLFLDQDVSRFTKEK